ncbi:hypothetical protein Pcinc_032499 [Petrolisthes cinctipes]|uniref:Uncharacterized protein n=1 Tax=Petrolisthes cinctipes TaxID=88211 RepID=A0AAE1EUH6_PETCI|nr:hypothetical protein Pcinc_032499 [Petrolisthes cinctipes]
MCTVETQEDLERARLFCRGSLEYTGCSTDMIRLHFVYEKYLAFLRSWGFIGYLHKTMFRMALMYALPWVLVGPPTHYQPEVLVGVRPANGTLWKVPIVNRRRNHNPGLKGAKNKKK